jgi:hypothetical protein
MITLLENNADGAAVVGFRFHINIQNCETTLVKIVCNLLKSISSTVLFFSQVLNAAEIFLLVPNEPPKRRGGGGDKMAPE